jgi:hypothetical protein
MFKNLKLSVKIGAGFAVCIAFSILIAVVAMQGSATVTETVSISDDANKLTLEVLKLAEFEKEYARLETPEAYGVIQSHVEVVREQIKTLSGDIPEENVNTLAKAINSNSQLVESYKGYIAEVDGLFSQWKDLGNTFNGISEGFLTAVEEENKGATIRKLSPIF